LFFEEKMMSEAAGLIFQEDLDRYCSHTASAFVSCEFNNPEKWPYSEETSLMYLRNVELLRLTRLDFDL